MAKKPKPDDALRSRAERLRERIDEIRERSKTGGASEGDPAQPRSLHETIEERMRDHVGEEKPEKKKAEKRKLEKKA